MTYLLVGDCHGRIRRLRMICRNNRDKTVFQLGDMGLGFQGVHLFPIPNLKFIRGNHDSPVACRKNKMYAGDYGGDRKLFWIGGAYSVDYEWRTAGVSWWPDEELTDEQFQHALRLYTEFQPEIVLSHEAPAEIGREILNRHDRLDKSKCLTSRTARALQQMLEIHCPKHWFFGHYHVTVEITRNPTVFQCLDELDTYELKID